MKKSKNKRWVPVPDSTPNDPHLMAKKIANKKKENKKYFIITFKNDVRQCEAMCYDENITKPIGQCIRQKHMNNSYCFYHNQIKRGVIQCQ